MFLEDSGSLWIEGGHLPLEALKRQSKGLSDEYSRMLLVNERLENKLADYELVFGDEVKKKK